MKKASILFLIITESFLSLSQTPSNDPNWQLVFNDDFNTIDQSTWKVLNNFDHYGGESQVYTNRSNNVFIENVNGSNNLVLQVNVENYSCPPQYVNEWDCARQYLYGQNYPFTSGAIETINTLNYFQYGYYEAKIKFPYGRGFWPAFWTFINGPVPPGSNAAEIDIAEQVGRNMGYDQGGGNWESNMILGTNIHLGYCPSGTLEQCPTNSADTHCPGMPCYGEDIKLPVVYSLDYHSYAIEWSPTRIIWYFDNKVVRILNNPGIVDPVKLIFNLALQGNLIDATTVFPGKMYIDYVRVYKLNPDCNNAINTCTYNFSAHDNKLKNEIIIGWPGCTNSVPSGSSTYLRASNDIYLGGDFTVPVGATFFADANGDCILPTSTCNFPFNACNYNFAGYDNGIKKQITLGGNGCTTTVLSGSAIMLKATDNIQLLPGFKIVNGATTTIKVVNCQ